MWKVEVEKAVIAVKSGVSARTQKPYQMREQEAWMYAFDENGQPYKHPQKISFVVPDDQPNAYPIGVYFVHPGSVYVDKWGQASVKVRLMPAAEFQTWVRSTFSPATVARAA
jgi:hypothetical protein